MTVESSISHCDLESACCGICKCILAPVVESASVQGESGGLGLGYVDINSVSFGGYPETELSQHNPVRDHQTHPVFMT